MKIVRTLTALVIISALTGCAAGKAMTPYAPEKSPCACDWKAFPTDREVG